MSRVLVESLQCLIWTGMWKICFVFCCCFFVFGGVCFVVFFLNTQKCSLLKKLLVGKYFRVFY